MRFIGRERELLTLEKMYEKNSFQMLVLYGRRRIGKTTLLGRFSEGKDPIFYTGIESKDSENLIELGNTVFSHFNPGAVPVGFRSFSDVLSYITLSIKRSDSGSRHLIIIDEYPYVAGAAPEFSSVLQREIDHEWKKLNIMLVLCGSSITFMEEEVLGEKSPLFGRRTGQINLGPFDYRETALFTEKYTPEEKAIVYGITGGIPKYIAELDPDASIDDNITGNFLSTSGYFYEEPKNLLRQEFRDISLYYAILNAIGNGGTQVSEISGKTGFDTAKISQALRKLEAVRIIRKEVPVLNEKNKKLTQYSLYDGMFRFWFRFIPKGTAAIERGYGKKYYENMVKPSLYDYMGGIFETICQEYVFSRCMDGAFDNPITRIGKWRGNDPKKKCTADIDIVAVNDLKKTAVIGECKFKNAALAKEEYETLLDRGRLVMPYAVSRYLIFSLSGVTRWVEEQHNPLVAIVPMEELYAPTKLL